MSVVFTNNRNSLAINLSPQLIDVLYIVRDILSAEQAFKLLEDGLRLLEIVVAGGLHIPYV
jgi:hypothetical protein